jgi:hypothetical protein
MQQLPMQPARTWGEPLDVLGIVSLFAHELFIKLIHTYINGWLAISQGFA